MDNWNGKVGVNNEWNWKIGLNTKPAHNKC